MRIHAEGGLCTKHVLSMQDVGVLPIPHACVQVVQGSKQMEGAGVQICRTVGTAQLRNIDPFLMLDELKLPAKQVRHTA